MQRLSGAPGVAILAAVLALAVAATAFGEETDEPRLSVELLGGDAYNFDSNLRIEQEGQPTLDFTGEWKTDGFSGAPYYILRFARWDGDRAIEAQLTHHKTILENPPAEVDHFRVTHGFNLIGANRAWRKGPIVQRYGGGIVLSHAENEVRGQVMPYDGSGAFFDSGFRLSGLFAQYGIGYSQPISDDWFWVVETKGSIAWAEVPVVNGEADYWNYAIHGAAGFGYFFE